MDCFILSYFLRLKTVEIPGINILMFSSPKISRVYLLLLAYMLAFSLRFTFSLLALSCPNWNFFGTVGGGTSGPLWNYVSLTPEHIGMENCWRAAQSTEHVPATQVRPLSSVLPALRIKGFFTLLYLNKQINLCFTVRNRHIVQSCVQNKFHCRNRYIVLKNRNCCHCTLVITSMK